MCLQYKSFYNTVGKGEIARNEKFLFFPAVFSTLLKNSHQFESDSKLSSAKSFSLEKSEVCVWESGRQNLGLVQIKSIMQMTRSLG